MSNDKKRESQRPGDGTKPKSEGRVTVRETASATKPVWRSFPGPRGADAGLRVNLERVAHAELIAHAKESLEAEVCGVLAGAVAEDDEGLWLHVEAIIRGTAATQGSTHVTFTQATWNLIHESLERDFPKLRIVGWYHTHPGFGVEFSDLDLFIQKNFFGGATQVALVTDPLSGAVAIAVNSAEGVDYLERYWVDGREQVCRVPASRSAPPATLSTGGSSVGQGQSQGNGESSGAVRNLEARIGQLIQAHDELRQFHYRFLLFCGAMFCLALLSTSGYVIYQQMTSRLEPPRLNQVVPVPIQVGDKVVMMEVGVAGWQVPPELNATLLQVELLKQQALEEAAKQAAKKAGATNSAGPAGSRSDNPTPPSK